VRVFVGMSRTDLGGELRPTIDRLHTWDNLAGVDLHGLENFAHASGYSGRVGSAAGGGQSNPNATRVNLTGRRGCGRRFERLGVTRIQHGVRAIEDPAVSATGG
jgi:adenosine deaminase